MHAQVLVTLFAKVGSSLLLFVAPIAPIEKKITKYASQNNFFYLISNEHDIAQARQFGFDDFFDEHGRNIFSSGSHNQLFDPAGDSEESVFALNPEVSSPQPSVLRENFLSLGRVVQVAHHHVATSHHDLATLVTKIQNLMKKLLCMKIV